MWILLARRPGNRQQSLHGNLVSNSDVEPQRGGLLGSLTPMVKNRHPPSHPIGLFLVNSVGPKHENSGSTMLDMQSTVARLTVVVTQPNGQFALRQLHLSAVHG